MEGVEDRWKEVMAVQEVVKHRLKTSLWLAKSTQPGLTSKVSFFKPHFPILDRTRCRILFISEHFSPTCRLRHVFLFSLTLCTSSIFGGVRDIKVQIFSGYSSPGFKGEVKKNTQQSIQNSLTRWPHPLIPTSPSSHKTTNKKQLNYGRTPCGVPRTVGLNAGRSLSARLK